MQITEENSCDFGQRFSKYTKSLSIKEKNEKLNFTKIKVYALWKTVAGQWKINHRQGTTFASTGCIKDFYLSKIY